MQRMVARLSKTCWYLGPKIFAPKPSIEMEKEDTRTLLMMIHLTVQERTAHVPRDELASIEADEASALT